MTDLYEVIADEYRAWAEAASDAELILHAVRDADRPVEVDDGYEYGQVA